MGMSAWRCPLKWPIPREAVQQCVKPSHDDDDKRECMCTVCACGDIAEI